jgi:hypothetical protein
MNLFIYRIQFKKSNTKNMRSRQKSNRVHERSASQIRQPQRLQRTHFPLFSRAAQRTTHHFGVRIHTQYYEIACKRRENTVAARNESVVKFVSALVSVQFCGQTAGSQRKFDEEIARRDNDENGCAGTRFHEGQAEGKENFLLSYSFHISMYVYMCMCASDQRVSVPVADFFVHRRTLKLKSMRTMELCGSAASAANHRRLN